MTPSEGGEVRQRLSAILFADVHNYTGAMERDQLGTHRRVMRRVNLFKSLIGDYEGRVFDVEGDAVKAVFDSAFQAVRFAVDLQREFRNDAVWNSDPEEPIFRIGINLGEVIVDADGAYYGHEVNVAARLQQLAAPGGICISKTVHRIVRDKLPIKMSPIGPQNLKNMAEPVEAYSIDLEVTIPSTVPSPRPAEPTPEPTADGASIVVLPFRNLSGDPSDSHLCDGITSDIITNLSRFRDILVIARHSAFFFRDPGHDLSDVRRQLGVRYALTGGLQRAENRLSINVQLVETDSGGIIWSDRYKGNLSDIFDFQDDITAVISARSAGQVAAAERRRISSLPPTDLRAYGLVLRGQELTGQYRREANLHARRLFEEAAHFDPNYGRSYIGMSRTFNVAWLYRWTDSPEDALKHAVHLALEAVKRDELDARGHSELGYAHLYTRHHEGSLASYGRAIQLNPNDADILADMADSLTYADQAEQAIELLTRAMRLNPLYPDWYLWHLGEAYFHVEDYESAIRSLKKMNDQSEAHRVLAASHAHLGEMSEARHHAAQVRAIHPEFSIEHWRTVPPFKSQEPLDRFIGGLRSAGLD